MSNPRSVLFFLGLIALGALAQTSCSTMFSGLKCRTKSQNPAQLDAAALTNSRNWLCNAFPHVCNDINNGGQFSTCNSAEQLSYAINLYYNQFSSAGATCDFSGLATLVTSTPATNTPVTNTPATSSASGSNSNTNQCGNMYASASCRTSSQNVDAGSLAGSRNWLCNTYPQFCLDINQGGAYASCTAAEQLTYAMSLYYNQFKSQGPSACDFGGAGKINNKNADVPATTQATISNGVNCTAMFNGLVCRTSSQNANSVNSGDLNGARNWVCGSYPQFCNDINNGGKFASCSAIEQASYAFDQYYAVFGPSQGASACNFNGLAKLASSGNTPVVSPAPAPAPAPTGSKAGLAWPINQFNDGSNPPLAPWTQGKISWIYTWSYEPNELDIKSTGLEWVPMLHRQELADQFISRIKNGAYDNFKNLLLFNEPDLNYPPYAYGLDVNTAITLTIQVFQAIQQRGKSWRVGTPVMSHNIGWLQQYMDGVKNRCPYCKFDFVPVHCYSLDANAFKGTVQSYRNTFGLPVWVTEFAATDFNGRNWQLSENDVKNFMSDTTNWLNAQSWVERYSWFGTMRAVDVQDKFNMVMNMDGSRKPLGDQYVLRGGSN